MAVPRRIPLAWCNLTHDWVRFALFTLGITFAVVLMGDADGRPQRSDRQQLPTHRPHARTSSWSTRTAPSLFYHDGVSRRRLGQAAAVPGVAEVHLLYIDYRGTELEYTGPAAAERRPARTIRVVGFDPDAEVLDLPEVRPASAGGGGAADPRERPVRRPRQAEPGAARGVGLRAGTGRRAVGRMGRPERTQRPLDVSGRRVPVRHRLRVRRHPPGERSDVSPGLRPDPDPPVRPGRDRRPRPSSSAAPENSRPAGWKVRDRLQQELGADPSGGEVGTSRCVRSRSSGTAKRGTGCA